MVSLLSWKIYQYFFEPRTPSASMLTCRRRAADTTQTLTQTEPLTLNEQGPRREVFPGGNGITTILLGKSRNFAFVLYFSKLVFLSIGISFMNAVVEFSPEKAWQAAVANLELDMSRATFSTWVKPTHLVEFSDDTFVIGCINAYGRDWLMDRLTTTLQRFLTGVLNREAKVRFVVCDHEVDDEEDLAQEENQDQEDDEEYPIDLDIHYSSIRNILLEPGRVVRLPVYNLRWLPYVGSQVIFLVMALWQEYYLASGGKGRKGSCKVSVRAERICQWAGISRAQFFRLLQTGSSLGWFTRKIDTDHEVDKRSGRAKKSSNKYELFESPLTPGDAEDLKTILLAHGIQDSPQSALKLAISANPKDILQYPVRQPTEDFSNMIPRHQTVQDVIRELVGHRLDGELGNLVD
ncbi:MAG: hypothetical protein C0403_19250 [Desulfobacterium sp.]|nr:hypothetical protein [Desulfobacterium sp.]